MELTNKDKLMICHIYDQILRKNETLFDLLSITQVEELQENVNYNDTYYKEQMGVIMDIVRAAQKMNPALDTESIIKFIVSPDFDVKVDVKNDALLGNKSTLQDTVLMRRTYSHIVLGEPVKAKLPKNKLFEIPTKITNIPVIRITRVDISEDMYYLFEEICYVPSVVLEKMDIQATIACKNNSKKESHKEQDKLHYIWDELMNKQYERYQIINPAIYRSMEDYNELFIKEHGVDVHGSWVKGQLFIIDNRPHIEELISEQNPAGTLQLKQQFKNR